jgi:chemotaxis protein methyltransferase WspC
MNARDLIRRSTGLNLTAQVADRAVAERLARLGQSDAQAYLRAIGPDELKALTELVVVPESWMFRDPEAFHTVARFVQDRLAAAPARLVRILSIPCAGGEEPYSIAMALADAGVARGATQIEAIDLSEVALERARRGRYTRNAFRGAELGFRERHFTQDGSDYQIDEALRAQVAFSQGNLLALDAMTNAGRYDIVFCRNLLIYFDDATTATAIAKLRLLLADEGMLFAGYAEVPAFCANGFTALRMPGAFALQKERRAAARVQAVDAAPPAKAAAPVARPAPASFVRAAPAAKTVAPAPGLGPQEPAAQLARAGQLADQGDYAGAATLCRAVLATHPASADAYFILGIVSDCSRQPQAAGDYWRRCVYLQPDHYDALCHLALLAEQTGDSAQAGAFRQRAARVYGRRGDGATRKQS